MPTITATPYDDEGYVLVEVDWTDVPAVQYARVWRINDVTGEETLLRPYVAFNANGDLLLTCSLGIWWDTDPPIDVSLSYRTEAADVLVNVAANSSFEAGVAPWTATNGVLAASATFAHAGAQSGRLTPNGTSFTNLISQSTIAIDPAKDVTMSLWALAATGWNSVRGLLRFFNGTTQVGTTQQTSIEILDDAEWRFLTLTATPPENTTVATITFEVSGTAAAGKLFYVDQFELGQMQPVTAYAVSASVSLAVEHAFFLKDPLNPCNDIALEKCMLGPVTAACDTGTSGFMVANHANRETYAPGTVLLEPVNRVNDVVLVRRRRNADADLAIITRTFADRDRLKQTLDPGTVLFIQSPPEYGIEDRYIAVTTVTIDRPIKDARIPPRFFTLPYRIEDRPVGPMNGPCGARVDDLCDIYSSWAALGLSGLDWRDLILGLASTAGPGQDTTGWRTYDMVAAEFADYNAVNTGGRDFDDLLRGL